METEYDLSKMKKRPNPFAKQLKKQITTQLEAMANDPSIQAEIQQIEQEFKITEMDGLTDL
ncbi:MAG: hypothetical protein ACRC78_05105 [Planktothrix sp.]